MAASALRDRCEVEGPTAQHVRRRGFEHLWKSTIWRAIAKGMASSDVTGATSYTADATPHGDGWHLAVAGLEGIEVVVRGLEVAESVLATVIAEHVGTAVEPTQVSVIPTLGGDGDEAR